MIARVFVPLKAGLILGGALIGGVLPCALAAQTDSLHIPPAIHHNTFVRVGALTLLATTAFLPLDAPIERRMQSARIHGGTAALRTANVFNWLGGPGTVALPLTMMALGWTAQQHPLFDVGIHAAEAVGFGSGITALLKGATGRARPTLGPADADDFLGGRGFRRESNSSFPSGHTTSSFALATALTMGTTEYAPSYARAAEITSYGIATTVGMARIYTNHHWSSDVALGAGVGTLAGLAVERWANERWAARRSVK